MTDRRCWFLYGTQKRGSVTLPLPLKILAHIHEAAEYAKDCSPDPVTKVGTKIVAYGGQEFLGFNDFPWNYKAADGAWHDRVLKNRIVVHAEVMAILNCRKEGKAPHTLYTTKAPCERCAGVIINSGVSEVYHLPRNPNSSWAESQALAHELLEDCGVQVTEVHVGEGTAAHAEANNYTIIHRL